MNEADKQAFEEWWKESGGGSYAQKVCSNLAWQAALAHRDAQPAVAQGEPVAVERYQWIFEDKHGDKFVQPNVYYTEIEAIESAKICGNRSVGKASEAPIICWDLKNNQAPAVAQEPVHFRAVICKEQQEQALGVVPKIVGFVDKKAAEQFILEKRDFQGWKYNLEPLYAEAPTVARPPAEVVRELVAALREFLEAVEEPPEPNCCCHISPPCADCVENSYLRDAFKKGKSALKSAKEHGL